MFFFRPAVKLALLLVTGLSVAWAQTAQIAGTITDPTGAVIATADITITRLETSLERKTASNAKGRYAVPLLPPGRYRVSVQHDDFVTATRSGILLSADQNVRLDFSLEVGQVTEQITVEGDVSQVDVETAALRQVIGRRRLVDLPLEGRNAAELTLLVAGAYEAPAAGTIRDGAVQFPGSLAISAGGARQNQISYNLDGEVHHDTLTQVNAPFPMPDSLEEFSVQASNYSAEFGSNAGAVVNVISKSGTNEFHGNAFAFHRNEVFNARNVFAAERDPLKRTQLGGTLGGPVHIPGLYRGRNKTFFFLGYQGTRTRTQDNALSSIVPTDANRQGDFSSTPQAVIDPLTDEPFPGNIIPLNRFDPVSVELLGFLPQGGASVVPLTVLDNGVGFGGALDFGEDILCRSCPDKGLGRLVARFQVLVDGGLEFGNTAEHAAADALLCQLAEPALDEIEPRRRRGNEVKVEAGVLREPLLHLLMLVRGVVVHDQMQLQRRWRFAVDLA